jgi:hypothetical protein
MKTTRIFMITRIISLFAAFLFGSTAALAAMPDGRVFATPDDAVQTLVTALKTNDNKTLTEIFGKRNENLIDTTDTADTLKNRQNLVKSLETYTQLRKDNDATITLVVGANGWPMPIPLVKDGSGWRFDSDKGAQEIINRRVGHNELATIDVLRAYPTAQRQFAEKPRDGSNVRSFARRIRSTSGKTDGLYWDSAEGEEASPFGPLLADSSTTRAIGEPYHGYYFKILTGQGPQAPGGSYSYIINGRMVAGYAMVAWPADYASSGVKTFIINHYGDVYEKDLGVKTAKTVKGMTKYNPDKSWKKVSD